MSSPVVKICGVRLRDDALTAAGAGADYVGMVFVPGRRRRITLSDARIITDALRAAGPAAPQSVGLFGDQPLPEVLAAIDAAGLDAVQLCGDESIAYCRQVLPRAAVIKVLHIANAAGDDAVAAAARRIDDYAAAGCTITLDSQVAGLHGGTGQSFDWQIAARLSARQNDAGQDDAARLSTSQHSATYPSTGQDDTGQHGGVRPSTGQDDAGRDSAGGGSAARRRFLLAGGLTPDNVAAAIAAARPWGVDVSSGVETGGRQDAAKIRQFIANAKGLA